MRPHDGVRGPAGLFFAVESGSYSRMDDKIRHKIAAEVPRLKKNKAFLEAVIAVCALAANADDEINFPERLRIDELIKKEPALSAFDSVKANDLLDSYIHDLRNKGEEAKRALYDKVHGMADDPEKARTLICMAYLVITADHEIREQEMREFERLCSVLGVDSGQLWRELGA